MRPTLRRCVTLEFTCKALDVLVAFLLLLSSFYAVYLLVSPQASSSCKHMSAPLEVEVITKLIPLVMFLPVLLAFVLVRETAPKWATILGLQIASAIVLSGWMGVCMCGAPANPVLTACIALLAVYVGVCIICHLSLRNFTFS